MNRPFLRALLTSAALAATLVLAGCNSDGIVPNGRAMAPLSEKMLSTMEEKQMDKESPILVRLFKEEAELEVWKQTRDGQYALLKTYPICRWSGELGPKIKEGDRQAPEGFYTIAPGQMNPNSNYYLAFNTGYPNAYDRAHGRTGSELMVHGDCSSRGCYAMTDEQMQEIYAIARESFFGGQKNFQLQAMPFRMTALNMAKHRNNPNFAFWKMIKEGYDDFEATHQEPKVGFCEKRYVFDTAPPANASRPLAFNARGKCPVYRIDPAVAEAVLDHRRSEQVKMAQYIAEGVSTVPMHKGIDGGMNPVFTAQLTSHTDYDGSGRSYNVASSSQAPGALPHIPNPPGTTIPRAKKQATPAENTQVAMATVPMPQPAPEAKIGEASKEQQPTTIAGLIGNIFGGSKAQASASEPAAAPEPTAAPTPETNTEMAARPKRSEPVRTATSAPVVLHPKPEKTAAPKPKAVAHATSMPAAKTKTAANVAPWPAEPKPAANASPWPATAKPAGPKTVSNSSAGTNAPKAEAKKTPPPTRQATRVPKPEKPAPVAEPEMRTAYAAPPASKGGLLSGAQPVVPAGSFSSLR